MVFVVIVMFDSIVTFLVRELSQGGWRRRAALRVAVGPGARRQARQGETVYQCAFVEKARALLGVWGHMVVGMMFKLSGDPLKF